MLSALWPIRDRTLDWAEDGVSHPRIQVESIDEIRVEANSFKTNLWLYKSIGGEVYIQTQRRRRRWWCLWLCRTRDSVSAERITIDNSYFARVEDTPFLISAASHEKECRNTSRCTLKHFAFGVGVKLEFPSGGAAPTTVPDLLPSDGVMSRARIEVQGTNLHFQTAAGPHPD